MDAAVLALLRCPVCAEAFTGSDAQTLRCRRSHAFDLSRSGFVTLLSGGGFKGTPDDGAMVEARLRVHSAGVFDALAAELVRVAESILPTAGPAVVVDVGAGPGAYLARILEENRHASGIALDASKYAARKAARIERTVALVADVWSGIPLVDGSAHVVLVVFAPRNVAEFARVLAPGGAVVVVTPQADHLGELAGPLGLLGIEADKAATLDGRMSSSFDPVERRSVRRIVDVGRNTARDLALMGPSAFHLDLPALEAALDTLPSVCPTTVAVDVSVYRARGH